MIPSPEAGRSKSSTVERRAIEEAGAWRRYLVDVSGASEEAYELVEELAWRRLARELARLGRPLSDGFTGDAS